MQCTFIQQLTLRLLILVLSMSTLLHAGMRPVVQMPDLGITPRTNVDPWRDGPNLQHVYDLYYKLPQSSTRPGPSSGQLKVAVQKLYPSKSDAEITTITLDLMNLLNISAAFKDNNNAQHLKKLRENFMEQSTALDFTYGRKWYEIFLDPTFISRMWPSSSKPSVAFEPNQGQNAIRIEAPNWDQVYAAYYKIPQSSTRPGPSSGQLKVAVQKLYPSESDAETTTITLELMTLLNLAVALKDNNNPHDLKKLKEDFARQNSKLTMAYGTAWYEIFLDPAFVSRMWPSSSAFTPMLNKPALEMPRAAQEAPRPEPIRRNFPEPRYEKAPEIRQPIESPLVIQQPIETPIIQEASPKNVSEFQQKWFPYIMDLMRKENFEYMPMAKDKYIYFTSPRARQFPRYLPNYINNTSSGMSEQQFKREQDNIAKELTQAYKIHLMPSEGSDYTLLLKTIVDALRSNPTLRKMVPVFKIAPIAITSRTGQTLPRIVFYIETGKDDAQQALNILYDLFKNTRGAGIRPRFNAKVNDLIWVAQGDGDHKGSEYDRFYELPEKYYYRSNFTGVPQDYHLKHPITGEELIN